MYDKRYKSHHDALRGLKQRYASGQDKGEYLSAVLNAEAKSRRAIYVHVPFCNKICSFCPFHRPDILKRREYHDYLSAEIQKIRKFEYMKAPIDAVYFGGGTPTALLPRQMDKVLKELHESFDIRQGVEISIETSATELTDEMLDVLIQNGVNRLSIGIQTFDDPARRLLGRRGSGEFAAGRVKRAIEKGIVNTNIDLIYNYPGATAKRLMRDLEIIKDTKIAGLSFYSLMIHDKTPIASKITDGERKLMSDTEREYHFFELILRELGAAGYKPFELTKLIRDGLDRYDYIDVRHKCGSCVGIGHGAGGNIEEYLYHNTAGFADVSDEIPVSAKGRVVLPVYRILDSFVYELQRGSADLGAYAEKLERPLEKILEPVTGRLLSDGLITREGSVITMTEKGLFWGNNIIDEFIRLL